MHGVHVHPPRNEPFTLMYSALWPAFRRGQVWIWPCSRKTARDSPASVPDLGGLETGGCVVHAWDQTLWDKELAFFRAKFFPF